jgi:hypothetical protein
MTAVIEKKCFTPRETSAVFGIPRTRVFELLKTNELTKIQLSARRILIPRESIEKYLATKTVTQPA